MVRSWYDVIDTGDFWEVRAHDAALTLRYSLRDDALAAASQMARQEWRLQREPTGVRVQAPAKGWELVRTFGVGSADAAA